MLWRRLGITEEEKALLGVVLAMVVVVLLQLVLQLVLVLQQHLLWLLWLVLPVVLLTRVKRVAAAEMRQLVGDVGEC